ncbi:FxsA family protein [Pelagibacteraceae bacterium]|nr:FxsA family protein [Pelagibacteraceae bacterium]
MNSLFLIIIGIPTLEIIILIKIGQLLGAISTIMLVFFTAIVGIYFAKIEGLNTIKSGVKNIYQNKTPVYEMLSGASIAIAAFLLILPGFITDTLGFLLLIPFTRKFIISSFFKKNYDNGVKSNNETIEAEIIEEKKKDEL